MTFKTELKAAASPAEETTAAVLIAALTREPDHQRALHTENLLTIACNCADMKTLKAKIRKTKKTGGYNLDDISP